MTEYVAGFLFDRSFQYVVLIKKTKPEWQKDKLNGVGGKIEPGETPLQAMVREFKEETGGTVEDWKHFTTLEGDDYRIYFFYTIPPPLANIALDSLAEEEVMCCSVAEIATLDTIPNLKWLIPMALSMEEDHADHFVIREMTAPAHIAACS